jgi:hypothetical protein
LGKVILNLQGEWLKEIRPSDVCFWLAMVSWGELTAGLGRESLPGQKPRAQLTRELEVGTARRLNVTWTCHYRPLPVRSTLHRWAMPNSKQKLIIKPRPAKYRQRLLRLLDISNLVAYLQAMLENLVI